MHLCRSVCLLFIYFTLSTFTVGVGMNDLKIGENLSNKDQLIMIPDKIITLEFDRMCQNIGQPEELISSVLGTERFLKDKSKRFHFITSFTSNIVSYASYAIALNSMFVLSHSEQYSFEIIDEQSYPSPEELDADARWNKVKHLTNAILKSQSTSDQPLPEWFVWIDADLIILDLHFSLPQILQTIDPSIEIIMSRDKMTTSFIANSGFIIVRNSPWSLQFLQAWWMTYDRSTCCDQNALTWLYQRKVPLPDVQERLLFLPADHLNTDFPAWEHHHASCSVLHLAGLSSLYRRRVFRYALEHLCASIDHEHGFIQYLPQLLVTRDFLQESLLQLNQWRLEALENLSRRYDHYYSSSLHRTTTANITTTLTASALSSSEEIEALQGSLQDILKYEDDEKTWVRLYYESRHLDDRIEKEVEQKILLQVYLLRKVIYEAFLARAAVPLEDLSESLFEYYCIQRSDQKKEGEGEERRNSTASTTAGKGEGGLSRSCYLFLRSLQDIVTAGFELLLSIKDLLLLWPPDTDTLLSPSYSSFSFSRIELEKSYLQILDSLLTISQLSYQSIPQEKIQAQFLYYLFKHHQFTIDFYSSFFVPAPESRSESQKNTELSHPIDQRDSPSSFIITLLRESVDYWELLIHRYHFFGSSYVLADPEKEYIAILSQLGLLLCSQQQDYAEGVRRLQEAITKQEEMLRGYQRIYIITNTLMINAQRVLSEMYYNLGLCSLHQQEKLLAKEAFERAIRGFEALGVEYSSFALVQARRLLQQLEQQGNEREDPLVLTIDSKSGEGKRMERKDALREKQSSIKRFRRKIKTSGRKRGN